MTRLEEMKFINSYMEIINYNIRAISDIIVTQSIKLDMELPYRGVYPEFDVSFGLSKDLYFTANDDSESTKEKESENCFRPVNVIYIKMNVTDATIYLEDRKLNLLEATINIGTTEVLNDFGRFLRIATNTWKNEVFKLDKLSNQEYEHVCGLLNMNIESINIALDMIEKLLKNKE
jgi:hypothetical protein